MAKKAPVSKQLVKAAFAGLSLPSEKRAVLPDQPLWDLYRDGITFSLLSKFIICRHRFWIRTVLGLREDLGFNHRIEYGSLFHAGLEEHARLKSSIPDFEKRVSKAMMGIANFAKSLIAKHPESHAEIKKWEWFACGQFELYMKHWHKTDTDRKYIAQEQVFRVPTKLPSGRVVDIRGKYDEIFEVGGSKTSRAKGTVKAGTPWLQENKTKGDIDEEGITSSLQSDLQTMMYLHTLDGSDLIQGRRCLNILYNVISRPLGQKWSPRQKKTESEKDFQWRVLDQMEAEPDKFFKRWNVQLAYSDLENFRHRVLFPLLEQVCDWWESIQSNPLDPWSTDRSRNRGVVPNPHHYQRPFGVYDSLAQGYRGDYFPFVISNGKDRKGLIRLESAFPELDDPSLSAKKD